MRSERRRILRSLLNQNLDFHHNNSSYASHNIHAFAAKYPPQLPKLFIEHLTKEGDVVLDPMMGSGTTILEAFLLNRKAIGFDIDPLAVRLGKIKTSPFKVSPENTSLIENTLITAQKLMSDDKTVEDEMQNRFDQETKNFIDYWFLPQTQKELMSLLMAIENVSDNHLRKFLEIVLSSIIVTKSGGVSIARDLAHSRPHRDLDKIPRNAIEMFISRLKKALKIMGELPDTNGNVKICLGDARKLNLPNNQIDLIVTSPPYANAIDYMRAHKFSLVWLGKSINELTTIRSQYIGSERQVNIVNGILPPNCEQIIKKLGARDSRKARILKKYFGEMKDSIKEMYRVLKNNQSAIIVVGTSTMRGVNIETHICLAEIAHNVGFEVIKIARRNLDRNRRMMPASFQRNFSSRIEQRMHEEYIIGLLKP